MGARSLSTSGRQLFIIDEFRDTGRPLLAVMADPNSIFVLGLQKFKRRTLYSNIVNDRSAVYYTTCIQKTDPFKDTDRIKVNYLEGYADVILDPASPVIPQPKTHEPATVSSVTMASLRTLKRIPLYLTVGVLVPAGVIAFLINSVIQNSRSSKRIKLYEEGQAGFDIKGYRVPILIKELRGGVEHAYETLNNSHNQEFLETEDEDDDLGMDAEERSTMVRERRMSMPTQPTLALAPCQFEMIRSLDELKWRKYPVWIHNHRHTHAAVILRMEKKGFEEGRVVLNHFANAEFLI